jgi:hypothetical protein
MGAAVLAKTALYVAPLWPAGHPPLKRGVWLRQCLAQSCVLESWRNQSGRLISPREGEMPSRQRLGRTEGSAKERRIADTSALSS